MPFAALKLPPVWRALPCAPVALPVSRSQPAPSASAAGAVKAAVPARPQPASGADPEKRPWTWNWPQAAHESARHAPPAIQRGRRVAREDGVEDLGAGSWVIGYRRK